MFPKTVKIGGYNYTIEEVDEPFGCGESLCHGSHNAMDSKIKLSKVGNPEYRKTVFLHEICHGIAYVYCEDVEYEESFVTQFAKGLYQVIHDNPDIFKHDNK